MSDANSINAILSQNIATNKSVSNNLKLIEIPKSIESLQIIRGQVIRLDSNGTIYIVTSEGEIKAKIEQALQIKAGDNINIKIDKGNPPINANIINIIKPATIEPQQIYTSIIPETAYPKSLSIEELIKQPSIKIDLLTPQIAQKTVSPYIEITDTKLQISENLPLQNILTSDIIPPDPVPTLQKSEKVFVDFKMNIPSTAIPQIVIIKQIISSPLEQPININIATLETPEPSVFTEISIKSYNQDKLPERAGNIHLEFIGFTSDKNFPVLKTVAFESDNEQYYALKTPVEGLTLGSVIEVDIIKSTNIVTIAPLGTPPIISQTIYLAPEIWSIMQEIKQVLVQASPTQAQAFNNIMPNPAAPAQLGGAALFFLSAMRSGDVQSWLGDKAVDIIKRSGKSDLINRLSGELSSLSRMSSEGATLEWRSLSLPLAWQNEIHKMVVNYRKEDGNKEDNEQKGEGKTRFVMDLNLSHMGSVQLDGLFIEKDSRLDLILRTEQSFSEAMIMEMRQKYKDALNDISFSGELSFQDKAEQWVSIGQNRVSNFIEDV